MYQFGAELLLAFLQIFSRRSKIGVSSIRWSVPYLSTRCLSDTLCVCKSSVDLYSSISLQSGSFSTFYRETLNHLLTQAIPLILTKNKHLLQERTLGAYEVGRPEAWSSPNFKFLLCHKIKTKFDDITLWWGSTLLKWSGSAHNHNVWIAIVTGQ